MKAAEVLQLYKEGRRDFKGVSLRGQNFKGKDLSGADFSGADIRSANFTNANLTGANFSGAKAGLQKRWAVGLAVVSLLLAVLSGSLLAYVGVFVSLIFDSDDPKNQIMGWVTLAVVVVFLLVLRRKGIGSETLAIAVAGAGAIAFAGSVAAIALTGGLTIAGAGYKSGAGALVLALAATLVSTYIGWRVLKGDERDAWIRSAAIAFATMGGTSFRGATLTDADFSQACLKSTDFRRALIRRTCWRGADKLDRIRPGSTYLNDPEIRRLLVSGDGQGQRFDRSLDLKGINLHGANLAGTDFCGSTLRYGTLEGANLTDASLKHTNLNNVNLRDANLSRALLKQAQLDQADLTGATLTGACIEDWGITTRTRLHGIHCDYVFMRFSANGVPDPNPHRKPDDWNKTFEEGEFVDFITPMVETLDLYHNHAVNPRALAIAFQDLRKQNPDANLEIISMEKRGKQRDHFLVRAEASSQSNLSELHSQYFERYNYLRTLPPQAVQALLIEKEQQVQMLAGMVGTAINRPGSNTNINNTYQTQGDTIVSEQGSNAPKYDLSNAQFAGGFAETVQGDQVGGTINNAATETLSLAEAAAEIQDLLKQLEQTAPAETMTEKMTLATQAIAQIEANSTFKQRAVAALTAGGMKAFESAIDHPVAAFVVGAIEEWKKS
ncbi:MAG: pentapeptide repeat-containing protein [Leptolyngbya sp. SIO3F4]|nr:pentapeptide repeat-containing protein [Leptolyngbya sp. SIO3F4]